MELEEGAGQVTVTLTAEMLAELADYADGHGISIEEAARRIIVMTLADE